MPVFFNTPKANPFWVHARNLQSKVRKALIQSNRILDYCWPPLPLSRHVMGYGVQYSLHLLKPEAQKLVEIHI